MLDGQSTSTLKSAFPDAKIIAADTLEFFGSEDDFFEILNFINQNKLSFSKIERSGESLDDLFWEVVNKGDHLSLY